MEGTMKAVVFRQPNDIVVEEKPIPQINPDELLIRSMAAGICRSDLDLLHGKYAARFPYPVTPGHEWSGLVLEVGREVIGFEPEDRVVGECKYGCSECRVCKSGDSNYCPNASFFGFTEQGAFAEYFKVKARLLHKLTDIGNWEDGALVEPFTVGYYAINAFGGVDGGQKVVIFGGGTIGACTTAAASGQGATVIGIEPAARRRELLRTVGADYTLDPTDYKFVDRVLELTGGVGADLAVEASGHGSALATILKTVRNSGRVVFTGINSDKDITTELGLIQSKGLHIRGTDGAPGIWPRALAFLGRIQPNLKALITHRLPLSRSKEAFEIASDSSRSVKVLIVPDEIVP